MGEHRRREVDVLLLSGNTDARIALIGAGPEKDGAVLELRYRLAVLRIRHAVGAELTCQEHTAARLPRLSISRMLLLGRRLVQRHPELYRESATGWNGCRPFTDIPPRFHRSGFVQ